MAVSAGDMWPVNDMIPYYFYVASRCLIAGIGSFFVLSIRHSVEKYLSGVAQFDFGRSTSCLGLRLSGIASVFPGEWPAQGHTADGQKRFLHYAFQLCPKGRNSSNLQRFHLTLSTPSFMWRTNVTDKMWYIVSQTALNCIELAWERWEFVFTYTVLSNAYSFH